MTPPDCPPGTVSMQYHTVCGELLPALPATGTVLTLAVAGVGVLLAAVGTTAVSYSRKRRS